MANRSIEDVILIIDEDMWQILAQTGVINMVKFDFKSAFDTAWINGFLFKMRYYYGVNGKIYKWMKSFLKGRYNRVRYRNYKTEWVLYEMGFSQGGPLSGIFFIIYLIDYKPLEKAIIRIIKYADDVDAWNKIILDDIYNILQKEIDNFKMFSNIWKLIISFGKCDTLAITRKIKYKIKKYTIKNGNETIKLCRIARKVNLAEDSDASLHKIFTHSKVQMNVKF